MKHVPAGAIEAGASMLPRIWADGSHDDLAGIVAAVENKAVEFDGAIYKKGDALRIEDRTIYVSRRIYVVGASASLDALVRMPDDAVVCFEGIPSRRIEILGCGFIKRPLN